MKVEDLKWYSPFLLLVGTILSFADPITDILTMVEFYRADHKTWFVVGLTFLILPCFVFVIVYSTVRDEELSNYSDTRIYMQTMLCGFNPFSAAFARLQGFFFCLNKWWRGDEIDSTVNEKAENLLSHIDFAVLFESVLELAPQFIIQLYAVRVQEEPVEVIQIISLPVSFLSLAWAFTTADELLLRKLEDIDALKVKHKLALFVTYLFLLSSRLFAVCYFTVSYKWWIIVVLLLHTFVITIVDIKLFLLHGHDECDCGIYLGSVFLGCIHWLRDDLLLLVADDLPIKTVLRRIQVLSHFLFVIENFVMILLFQFSQHSNTWYSLPVTVCVCVFSVLGSVIRLIIYHRVILKERIVPILND